MPKWLARLWAILGVRLAFSVSVQEQVRRLHGDRLDDLGDVLFELGSVEELKAWLRQGV